MGRLGKHEILELQEWTEIDMQLKRLAAIVAVTISTSGMMTGCSSYSPDAFFAEQPNQPLCHPSTGLLD
jgi:hypothetical protein